MNKCNGSGETSTFSASCARFEFALYAKTNVLYAVLMSLRAVAAYGVHIGILFFLKKCGMLALTSNHYHSIYL